jgi:hypothetical protein
MDKKIYKHVFKLDKRYVTLNFRPPEIEVSEQSKDEVIQSYFFSLRDMQNLIFYCIHRHSLIEFLKN